MARLTRVQKYADLRDKIVQDREESLKTSQLSSYEDKLKNLESFVNKEPNTDLNRRTITPVQEVKPTISDEVKQAEEESMKSLEQILNDMMGNDFVPITEEPINVTPIQDVKPIIEQDPIDEIQPVDIFSSMETIKNEIKETSNILNQESNKVEAEPAKVEPIQEVKPVVEQTPINETTPVDIMSTMEIVSDKVNEISDIINQDSNKVEAEPAKVEPITPIEIKAEPVNNSFIDSTFTEVNNYNREAGRTTLNELPDSLVEEVRHPQETVEEKENDDFSNTVSIEIEKVLSELNNNIEVPMPVTPTPVIEEPVTPQVEEAEFETKETYENPEVKQETFEHPVLTKTIEEPVVEIKNINDTITNTKTDTNILDDTIPFVVDKEEDEEYEDEDEEEAPSKVLNVILGILIFVLVAVLGVIVYYILVAKGIIG